MCARGGNGDRDIALHATILTGGARDTGVEPNKTPRKARRYGKDNRTVRMSGAM